MSSSDVVVTSSAITAVDVAARRPLRFDEAAAAAEGQTVLRTTDAVAAAPSSGAHQSTYQCNPWTLQFIDAAVEARYCEFQYITSGFYGGKLYLLAALMIVALSFVVFQPPPMPVPTVFGQPFWIPLDVAFVFNILNLVFAFVPALRPYREIIFLLTIFTHWPGFTVMVMYAKSPRMYRYTYLTGCYYVCTFSAQPRFSRVFPFLTIVPLTTLIVSTLVVPSYFQTHSPMEIIYWPLTLTPLILLRFFEQQSREAFVVRERAEVAIHDMAVKTAETRKIVVNFFPPTPTYELLYGTQSSFFVPLGAIEGGGSSSRRAGRNMRRSERLLSTVLVLTDLAGFTAWAAATPPLKVMQTLDAMFNQIDALAARHNVEKVCTVGDAYFGAIFRTLRAVAEAQEEDLIDSTAAGGTELGASLGSQYDDSAESLANRCHEAIVFATEILPTSGSLMRMRVGVHCGDVIGGFVGCDPPRFDLFGPAVDVVKKMEQGGTPGRVHVSHAALAAARRVGDCRDSTSTELGLVIDAWERREPAPLGTLAADPTNGADHDATDHHHSHRIGAPKPKSTAAFLSSQIDEDTVASLCEQICSLTEDRAVGAGVDPHLSAAAPAAPSPEAGAAQTMAPPRGHRRRRHRRNGATDSPQPADEADDEGVAWGVTSGGQGGVDAGPRQDDELSESMRTTESVSGDSASVVETKYALSPFLLYFYDARVEAKYLQWLQGTAIPTTVAAVFIVQHGVIIAAHLALACFDTVQDRLVLMYIVLATFGLSAYVRFVRDAGAYHRRGSLFQRLVMRSATGHQHVRSRLLSSIAPIRHALFIIAVFYSMSIVASLGITSVCSDGRSQDQRVQAIGDVVSMYVLFALYVAQLILEVRLPIRLAMNLFICTAELGWIALRRATLKDEVKVYEMYPLVLFLAASVLSYFADYSLRSAFASANRLRQMQQSALGNLLEVGDKALDVMLPRFVIDAMLADEDSEASGIGGRHASSGALPTTPMADTALLLVGHDAKKSRCMVWEYIFAVVLFVRVEISHNASGSGAHRALISRTHDVVAEFERIGRRHGVAKVKSIGTMVLLVAGIHHVGAAGGRDSGGSPRNDEDGSILDDNRTGAPRGGHGANFASSCVAQAIRAALDMIQCGQVGGEFAHEGGTVAAGIHCGPCFGAVIGDIGLGFDTFGDTVNTASRMQSVAQDGTLIVSSSVQALLPTVAPGDGFDRLDVEFRVTARGAVPIKGKGTMDVFQVERAAT